MANEQEFSVVPLHEHRELMLGCCKLLNDEWPRSETARLRSIESSCPNLPTSLIIIREPIKEVVGHAKICRLPRDPEGCWIESVVISPAYRGKGLGRLIMDECEKFAVKLGFTFAFLSTHDQQGFYGRLGYDFCAPICHFGSGGSRPMVAQQNNEINATAPRNNVLDHEQTSSPATSATTVLPPPPPPPPMPKPFSIQPTSAIKMYMKKRINTTTYA